MKPRHSLQIFPLVRNAARSDDSQKTAQLFHFMDGT
jgi:hypothetical protein